jgi:hypothetical protein
VGRALNLKISRAEVLAYFTLKSIIAEKHLCSWFDEFTERETTRMGHTAGKRLDKELNHPMT